MVYKFKKISLVRLVDFDARVLQNRAYSLDEIHASAQELLKDGEYIVKSARLDYGQQVYAPPLGGVQIVVDYKFITSAGRTLVNLGCCIFDYNDIKNYDFKTTLEFLEFLTPKEFLKNPLSFRTFAKKLIEKRDAMEASNGTQKQG